MLQLVPQAVAQDAGPFTFPGARIIGVGDITQFIVRAASPQTNNLVEIQDNGGTPLVSVTPAGSVVFGQASIISTTAGDLTLSPADDVYITNSGGGDLMLQRLASVNGLGEIYWLGDDSGSPTYTAKIRGYAYQEEGLSFWTDPSPDNTNNDLVERMRITSAGEMWFYGDLVFQQASTISTTAGDLTLDPAGGAVLPSGASTIDLGSTSAEWANLYIGTGKVYFGATQQVSLETVNYGGNTVRIRGTGLLSKIDDNNVILHAVVHSDTLGFYPRLYFQRSLGTEASSTTVTAAGTPIGEIRFSPYDGAFQKGVQIIAYLDAAGGLGDMPTRLEFLTTPDGGTVPLNALTIKSNQDVWLYSDLGFQQASTISTTAGDLDIAPAGSTVITGDVDIWEGTTALIFGADSGAHTRTDVTQKIGRVSVPHYTNVEQPMAVFYGDSNVGGNTLNFGGGTALQNAATVINFYTAADGITTTGTKRFTINNSGVLESYGNLEFQQASTISTTAGDLTIDSAGNFVIQDAVIIDITSTEALLVRKNGDTGNIFIADTSTPLIIANAPIHITTQTSIRRVSASTGPWVNEVVGNASDLDNVLFALITVTVPNPTGGMSGFIVMDYTIRTLADRTSETGQIRVDISRRFDANTVKAIADTHAGVEQQSGAFAETLAVTFSTSALVGAAGATQTFDIEVTIDTDVADSNTVCSFFARCLSDNPTGQIAGEITLAVA